MCAFVFIVHKYKYIYDLLCEIAMRNVPDVSSTLTWGIKTEGWKGTEAGSSFNAVGKCFWFGMPLIYTWILL